jgi:hypothetical protein
MLTLNKFNLKQKRLTKHIFYNNFTLLIMQFELIIINFGNIKYIIIATNNKSIPLLFINNK